MGPQVLEVSDLGRIRLQEVTSPALTQDLGPSVGDLGLQGPGAALIRYLESNSCAFYIWV